MVNYLSQIKTIAYTMVNFIIVLLVVLNIDNMQVNPNSLLTD